MSLGFHKALKAYLSVFSVALSVLLLMLIGLLINQLTIFGLTKPLSTLNIFVGLDILTLVLLGLNFKRLQNPGGSLRLPFAKISREAFFAVSLSLFMCLLAIFGAFRLNNGGSNILTLVLFGLVPIIFLWLIFRPNLKTVYPIVISIVGLAILFTLSLRGWGITGYDIQKEFYVFQLTLMNQHWSVSSFRDPYNACLSITILPTIIAKITSISSIYIFKIVFQILFAIGLIPIYWFIKLVSNKTIALIGLLIFITFPVFQDYIAFLNRQEIAFIFFALLLLTFFISSISKRQKNTLSLILFLGMILSHYSSTYVALATLILARLIYALVVRIQANHSTTNSPVFVLNWSLLAIAVLMTFAWNMQITSTGSSLTKTLTSTLRNALDHSEIQAADISYSIFSSTQPNPEKLLSDYAAGSGGNTNTVQYVPSPILPLTRLGTFLTEHGVNVENVNRLSKQFSSAAMQVLLLLGVIIMGYKIRKEISADNAYIFCLSLGTIVLLALITLLPQVSVDYGALRLFQQLLIFMVIPIVIGSMALVPFKRIEKFKVEVVAVFFALLSLLLTGFIGTTLGAYPAAVSLSNSGDSYEQNYVHSGEIASAGWLLENVKPHANVYTDGYARLRLRPAIYNGEIKPQALVGFSRGNYIYLDFANVKTGAYQAYVQGTHLRYVLTINLGDEKNLVYNNGQSKILK
jgi:uncharacterized membrane protein